MKDIDKIIQILSSDIKLGEILLESQQISFRDLIKELLTTENEYCLQPFIHYKNKFNIRYHQFSHIKQVSGFTQEYKYVTQHVVYIGPLSVNVSDNDIEEENVYAGKYSISMFLSQDHTTYDIEEALNIIESLLKPY